MDATKPFDKERAYSWYPGHMRKAQKRMAADLRYVDAVLEIRDARLPRGSGNSELGQLIDNKPRLLIFNKAALSDPGLNRQWAAYYKEKEIPTLFMDAATKSGLNLILPPLKKLTAPRAEKFLRRGIRPPPGRLMVIGMPNVGKSTFINRLVSKNRLKTEHLPGTTRGHTWVPLREDFLLMDTPGVMLPRLDTEKEALRLAWIGAIPDGVMGTDRVVDSLIAALSGFPTGLTQLKQFYRIENLPENAPKLVLENICRQRGFKITGGFPDLARAGDVVLKDFREGRIGSYTFEVPGDSEKKETVER